MNAIQAKCDESELAKCVSPEDLHRGDFVAVLNSIYEFPSFLWCCDSGSIRHDEPVRVQFKSPTDGVPLKIKAICLPFVLVRLPNGRAQSIDVRQNQFVRLTTRYAKTVWRQMKRDQNWTRAAGD